MRCIHDFWSLNDYGNMKVSAIPTTYESLTPIYVDQNRSDAWRENNCLQKTEKKILFMKCMYKNKNSHSCYTTGKYNQSRYNSLAALVRHFCCCYCCLRFLIYVCHRISVSFFISLLFFHSSTLRLYRPWDCWDSCLHQTEKDGKRDKGMLACAFNKTTAKT